MAKAGRPPLADKTEMKLSVPTSTLRAADVFRRPFTRSDWVRNTVVEALKEGAELPQYHLRYQKVSTTQVKVYLDGATARQVKSMADEQGETMTSIVRRAIAWKMDQVRRAALLVSEEDPAE